MHSPLVTRRREGGPNKRSIDNHVVGQKKWVRHKPMKVFEPHQANSNKKHKREENSAAIFAQFANKALLRSRKPDIGD